MKYSIIIAAARTTELNKCIEALKKQKFPAEDFEVIILLDKPSKLELTDSQFRVFFFPAKTHPSHKRNFGAAKSQGEILCFLDDDTEVPSNWLSKISKTIEENPDTIISGPNQDLRKEFRYRTANSIQENFLTEGLRSHLKPGKNYILTDHHNMPLCHLIVPRKIYNEIHGFNEVANYFMDDVEFNYLASKTGYELRFYPQLQIQHNVRPLFLPYFRYKFKTRYQVGKNFLLFPECYYKAKQIWLIGVSYLFLLFLPFLIKLSFFWSIIFIVLGIYLLLILFSNIKYLKKPWEYPIITAGVILVHILSWLGFTMGLIIGFSELVFYRRKTKNILNHKKLRYKTIKK